MSAAEPPVIVDDLPADEYHADTTTVSSTGLRKILPPGCPALFKYDRDNPQAPKRQFDLGHAAHTTVLGVGEEIVVTEYDDWRTKAAREERDAIRAIGAVPLLADEGEQIRAMAAAIRQHPQAGPLFALQGVAERSIYWTDEETGVRCRIRPDWLVQLPGLTLCIDLKTTVDASPAAVSKTIEKYSYHQQDALYTEGLYRAGQAPDDVRFLFAFQQKTPPYLVTIRELKVQEREVGHARNRHALRIYTECTAADTWPDWTGPVDDIPFIGLPTWALIRETEEYIK